jgi:hypothetical protein
VEVIAVMKFLLSFSLLVVAASAISQEDAEKHEQLARSILVDCRIAEGGTARDFDLLIMNGKFPETQTGRCMMTCMVEKMGYVSWSWFASNFN